MLREQEGARVQVSELGVQLSIRILVWHAQGPGFNFQNWEKKQDSMALILTPVHFLSNTLLDWSALGCAECSNTMLQTGQLIKNKNLFFTVLGTEMTKTKLPEDSVSGAGFFLLHI